MLKSVNGGICPAGYYNGLDAVAVQQFFIQHLHSSIKVCRVSWCQQSHLRLKFQTINSNWLKFVSYTASLGEIIYMDGGGIRSAGAVTFRLDAAVVGLTIFHPAPSIFQLKFIRPVGANRATYGLSCSQGIS